MGKTFFREAKENIFNQKDENLEERSNIAKRDLDITQKYFPEYIDEMRGYADGAGVSFFDLWAVSIDNDTKLKNSEHKCTSIITNEGKLVGHNEDNNKSGLENTICLVKKTLKDLTIFEIFYYSTLGGNAVGINSYGYVNAINTLEFTDTKNGIPKNILARYLAETNNPIKGINKIKNLPRASGYNYNIVNKNGEILNIEVTQNDISMIYPASPFVHSNHRLLNPSLDISDKGGTISRLEFAQKIVKNNMTVDELIELQSDTSNGPDKSLFNERTIAQFIVDFNKRKAKVWLLREKELGWVDYPLDFI